MLANPSAQETLEQLKLVLGELQTLTAPKGTNRLGVKMSSDKVTPLVKELGLILKRGIEANIFSPDVVTHTFYQTFGTSLGIIYQQSASGNNDTTMPAHAVQCPCCGQGLIVGIPNHPDSPLVLKKPQG